MGLRHLWKKFRKELNSRGLFFATKKTGVFLANKMGLGSESIIRKRKLRISKELNDLYFGTVAYGPFKGLKLGSDSWWCGIDRASMLLGIYEKEILESLQSIPQSHKTFINLGAADGYYAIGTLFSNKFDFCYSYEEIEKGRECIFSNAITNKVAEKLKVHGIAESGFYKILQAQGVDLSKTVVLSDIEGGEFDLFDEETFKAFRGAVIFIEIHDLYFDDGAEKLEKLKADACKYFRISDLVTGARDLSIFPELRCFNDNDRWLICSEARPRLGLCLRLDPK
jgi:hypothetical protein